MAKVDASPGKKQQRAKSIGEREQRYQAKKSIPGNQPILGREGESLLALPGEGATQAPGNS
ncbi:MAG: hypothetical protein AB7Y74_03380 [Syntrophorhabdus sp.]